MTRTDGEPISPDQRWLLAVCRMECKSKYIFTIRNSMVFYMSKVTAKMSSAGGLSPFQQKLCTKPRYSRWRLEIAD